MLRRRYRFALSRRLWFAAYGAVAMLFRGFVDVVEVSLWIVSELRFDLASNLTRLFHNRVFHLKAPLTLPACTSWA
jgi:hypothetical protein